MDGTLSKKDFKEKYKYSESTYHRRINLFKQSKFRKGYIAPTKNEVHINIDLYEQFLKEKSAERLHYQTV
ncbi:hypothetical protein IGI37_002289 [Enterococcus sp. AZ194]|uniref:hypothetical protein n=1 Tax=Enterococcus sp. AZ194 TaxID=2774629 RepID=UPI003F241AC7